ncbi:Protein of unknown function [Pyronema omphalodes CBS 100304]|uniref:Uncharacterized protein n=1 Tax=Pyronema omphalodes (strain CBS 100304) TaxID=1076935 RepID=U4LHK8_PYROM|nr:Protein of unknown function [Pyronema omphalodes CBS 100304]
MKQFPYMIFLPWLWWRESERIQ